MYHLCYNKPMIHISSERVWALMHEQRLTMAELVRRLRKTHDNEKLARSTIHRILNDEYSASPGASIVVGLAKVLGVSTDYLYGLSDVRRPVLIDDIAQADEDTLLALLAEQNAELAEMMRAIRQIPEEEQAAILAHLTNEIEFLRRLTSGRWNSDE